MSAQIGTANGNRKDFFPASFSLSRKTDKRQVANVKAGIRQLSHLAFLSRKARQVAVSRLDISRLARL
jgi:hypothetical protein